MTSPTDWIPVIAALRAPAEIDSARRVALIADALGLGTTITDDSAGCSVTEVTESGFRTPATSNELALTLDLAQYADDDGPCVAACRDHRPHSVAIMDVESSYAGFTAAALEHGVRSSLSLPLAGVQRSAALNLYATSPSAFGDPRARRVAELLARCVAGLLSAHNRRTPPSPSDVDAARARHDLVRRAQRTIARSRGVTEEAALTSMMYRSRKERSSIFKIVDEVLRGDAGAAPVGGDS